MTGAAEFGRFLRARRDAITPEQAGLPSTSRRRVPGLRREELAVLAGVSTAYLVRLEQGHDVQASPAVLRSLSRALQLTTDEERHLETLTRRDRVLSGALDTESLRPEIATMLSAISGPGAYVTGLWGDVLGWNEIGHRLIGGDAPFEAPQQRASRPNTYRQLFSEAGRALFVDWDRRASDAVADLRIASAQRPSGSPLHRLIESLSRDSSEFTRYWQGQGVQLCTDRHERYDHPEVGLMTLYEEVFTLPHDEGQHLVLVAAAPGTESAERLARLGGGTRSAAAPG